MQENNPPSGVWVLAILGVLQKLVQNPLKIASEMLKFPFLWLIDLTGSPKLIQNWLNLSNSNNINVTYFPSTEISNISKRSTR